MKKLLLAGVAMGSVALAAPAHADVELEVGGYFKGYGVFIDQDEDFADVNGFDFIRDTEIHIGGETTLDNGLTIGTHFEIRADGIDASDVEESYVYFSGNWGRVNFGSEDGVGYLLQVAAPSADSNIDGIRQFVQPVNYSALTSLTGLSITEGIDYDMDPTGRADKLSYLSPIMNGFQAGVSFSPDTDAASDLAGVGTDDVDTEIGMTYEVALRYEGQFQNVGVIAGAGYSHGDLEDDTTAGNDDRQAFNVGLDLDISAFGLGVSYSEDNGGRDGAGNDDEETLVIGADYTTGPFKIGLSYFDQDNSYAIEDLETMRFTGGVIYNYGPGMSFRGSVSYIEHELDGIGGAGTDDVDATSFVLGTQINF